MIGSLMYLTSSRLDIMFPVCACACFQVTPKASYLHAVKGIFRYLKGKPHLGLWYPKDSPFNLVAYSDSDYAGASLDRKSTTGGCQFLVDEKDGIEVFAVDLKLLLSGKFLVLVDCLPNEKIFTELARMGYKNPSTKLTFYKVFSLAQWKFLIHTILQCMSAKRTAWNEFSSSMASAVICLTTGRKFNFSKYIFDNLVRNVDRPSKFYTYPRFLQLMINAQITDLSSHTTKYTSPALIQKVFANMKRVGKGLSGVYTPLFDGMLVPQQAQDVEDAKDEDDVNEVSAEPTPPSPTPVTPPPPPQQEHIPSPPQAATAQPSPPPQQQPSHNAEISMTLLNQLLDTCATLTKQVANLEQDKVAQAIEITKLKQRVRRLEKKRQFKSLGLKRLKKVGTAQRVESSANTEVDAEVTMDANVQGRLEESQAKVYHLDVEHADKVLSMQETDEAEPAEVEEVIKVVTAAKLMIEVVTTATTTIIAALVPKASALRRRRGVIIQDPQEAATVSVIMQSERAAKKQKINEEVEELKTHLHSVPNDEDNMYTEATPLALKVLIIDYQIHHEHNKPFYKIIKEDGTHQLFLSFITLLRNFNREDLEMLWKLFQERFQSSEPKNFLDDFLLNTLKTMFEKPNVEASIWRDQRGIYRLAKVKSRKLIESCGVYIIMFITTQMILLVERKDPLTRFTLEQMLNNVRLEVKEESEMSLELLRLMRRQQQEGYKPE
nr:uncharacterized mitochondrial protein AtMg00810-like [Tanacetum cinerariifolium]